MKAVLYCRISTSTSFALNMIRGQQLRLLDYAKEKGIEVTGMYLDVGYLGSTPDNPGARAVVQAIREGKADTVLVTDRDRLNKGIPLEELQSLPVIALAEEEQRAEREAGREL
jgi:resolvase, N terminal domain